MIADQSDKGHARGYSWEPFGPGNEVAVKHGAWSPRRVDPLATEMVATVADATWLRPADRPALWSWARCEARIQLVVEWLEAKGDLSDDGEVRPAADLLTRLEAQASGLRARLGLDPLSRARLGRDVAAQQVDLARLWATNPPDGATAAPEGAEPVEEGE